MPLTNHTSFVKIDAVKTIRHFGAQINFYLYFRCLVADMDEIRCAAENL